MLGKNFSKQQIEIFFLFLSQKIGFDIFMQIVLIGMKCQSVFWEK